MSVKNKDKYGRWRNVTIAFRVIRRNIGSTRARDFYDLHILYKLRKQDVRRDILKEAVLHTAQKRGSIQEIQDWKEILNDIHAEQNLYLLWRNYIEDNKYIGELEFQDVLKTLNENHMEQWCF